MGLPSQQHCRRCGAALPAEAKFCGVCGAVAGSAAAPVAVGMDVSCRRCGHLNGPGDRFCRRCGAELPSAAARPATPVEPPTQQLAAQQRPRVPPAPPPPVPDGPDGIPARRSRAVPVLAVAAVLLLAAGAGSAAVLLSGGGASHGREHRAANAAEGEAGEPSSGHGLYGISEAQVRQVLDEYAAAYSAESPAGLQRIFASDLVRKNGSMPAQSLQAALAEYRKQFSELRHPRYTLSNVQVTAIEGAEAEASGEYSIADQYGDVGGAIAFHMVRPGSRLLIDRITIHPAHG